MLPSPTAGKWEFGPDEPGGKLAVPADPPVDEPEEPLAVGPEEPMVSGLSSIPK